jgi:hypothetical protein
MANERYPIFCPGHAETRADLDKIRTVQANRKCGDHEARIELMFDTLNKMLAVDVTQWDAINKLRRLIYMGVGGIVVAATIGSFLGNLLIKLF